MNTYSLFRAIPLSAPWDVIVAGGGPSGCAAAIAAAREGMRTLLGIRETRRIDGDYTLTLDDYMARRSFPDEVVRNCYFIDIHHNAADSAKNVANRSEGLNNPVHYRPGESHGIPYRCLVPKSLRNVLVAGRSISCERAVQGSVRVMPVCLAMGEAAGMAAAHAIQFHDGNVHVIDTARLRGRLREEGAYLP